MSHSFTQRHLPLITTRIEFRPEQLPSHPSVTTHQEFTPEQTFDLISSEALDDFEAHFNKASTPFEDDNTSDMHDEAVDDSPMDLDDDGRSMTSESEDEEDRNMIEKPKGEVSRQYKLADELQKSGWTLEQIDKLRNYIHKRADIHLDTSVSYSSQKKNMVNLVCAEAQIKFRELEDYKNFWPIIDILKTRLKCTSERARKQVTTVLADKARARIVKRKGKGKENPNALVET